MATPHATAGPKQVQCPKIEKEPGCRFIVRQRITAAAYTLPAKRGDQEIS
jgi:hypothetical protein